MSTSQSTFRVVSPPPGHGGAIAMVAVQGDIESLLRNLRVTSVAGGRTALRRLPGVDTLVICRDGDQSATLFPHAGRRVMEKLLEALQHAGCRADPGMDPWAGSGLSVFDRRLAAALGHVCSPDGLDVLLEQRACWTPACEPLTEESSEQDAAILRRYIEPPVVVALGRPNIGKSSLLNALAGRGVSIVSDEAGTTRDHVGVGLNLGGLAVRYLDLPGIDAPGTGDAVQTEAQEIAIREAARADLILLCTDATHDVPPMPTGFRGTALTVGLRADLGSSRTPADVHTCARSGAGIAELVGRMREALVPAAVRRARRAWRFWEPTPTVR